MGWTSFGAEVRRLRDAVVGLGGALLLRPNFRTMDRCLEQGVSKDGCASRVFLHVAGR